MTSAAPMFPTLAVTVADMDGIASADVFERVHFILLGPYPLGQHWRPAIACLLFVALYVSSALVLWRKPAPVHLGRWLLTLWIGLPAIAIVLLRGGVLGLTDVTTEFWGGLPLTFLLSTVGFAGASPLAILLALGRRSTLPAIRLLSIAYIELIRSVPLVSVLFMASVMFPLFVPASFTVDKLLRAQIAFTLVIAAYLAEVVRAGLQAIPTGQYEAAASLGLSFWPTTLHVVLPQALRISIPSIVNTFIAFFKDTSLVAVIGLFDLLGAARLVIVDPKWMRASVEVYAFAAAVYFIVGYAISHYSQQLERRMAADVSG
jgi:general L-amino acid transport system permease protein